MSSNNYTKLTEKQQYWLGHIQLAKSSDRSFSDYAQQHALDLKALYNYHWLLRKRGLLDTPVQPSQFIKITPPVKTKTPAPVLVITLLFPNGIRLEVAASTEDLPTFLQQVQSL